MNHCPRCSSTNVDDIGMRVIRIDVDETAEIIEMYCNDCDYGWDY